MSINPRITARLDDDLKSQISKKLQLKKFSHYDESKLLRAAINNFVDQNLFNYISNIDTIIKVSNEMILDMNGLTANISQIIDHLEVAADEDINITIDNFSYCKKSNIEYVQEVKRLVKLLRPFEKNKIKNHTIIARVDQTILLDVKRNINIYKNLKLDKSKLIRAALKYFLDKRYYILSDNQIKYARELMKLNNDVANITNDVNRIAFELNCNYEVKKVEMIKVIKELNIVLHNVHQIVIKLYDESKKFN